MENNPKLVEDPRFHVCFREMIICYVFFFALIALVMLATYTLGNYFVLGLPFWFLVAGIILPICFILIIYILTEKVFEDTPLDPYLD